MRYPDCVCSVDSDSLDWRIEILVLGTSIIFVSKLSNGLQLKDAGLMFRISIAASVEIYIGVSCAR